MKTLALLVEPMGGLLRRLLYLFALSAIIVLMLAPAALAQSGMESEGGPSGPYGKYTCADFADLWEAQEAYLQGGNGSDPAADRSILDPNGNGIACEDLPPADREPPVRERSVEEPSVVEEPEGEKTGRERRERTGGEEAGGIYKDRRITVEKRRTPTKATVAPMETAPPVTTKMEQHPKEAFRGS